MTDNYFKRHSLRHPSVTMNIESKAKADLVLTDSEKEELYQAIKARLIKEVFVNSYELLHLAQLVDMEPQREARQCQGFARLGETERCCQLEQGHEGLCQFPEEIPKGHSNE